MGELQVMADRHVERNGSSVKVASLCIKISKVTI